MAGAHALDQETAKLRMGIFQCVTAKDGSSPRAHPGRRHNPSDSPPFRLKGATFQFVTGRPHSASEGTSSFHDTQPSSHMLCHTMPTSAALAEPWHLLE